MGDFGIALDYVGLRRVALGCSGLLWIALGCVGLRWVLDSYSIGLPFVLRGASIKRRSFKDGTLSGLGSLFLFLAFEHEQVARETLNTWKLRGHKERRKLCLDVAVSPEVTPHILPTVSITASSRRANVLS